MLRIANQRFTVRESDRDLDTGIEIRDKDRIRINTSGEIWSGVLFSFGNDADGWVAHHANGRSPLPGAPPFSMLARVGRSPFFLVGKNFDHIFKGNTGNLVLRINDDVPANGSGAFSSHVIVDRNVDTPIAEATISVREDQRDVDTGLDIRPEDRVTINGSGFIWAGIWFTGENGPDGWPGWNQTEANAPLQGVPPYALIAKVGQQDYFMVGRFFNGHPAEKAGRLFLRINDHDPGNGSGLFTAKIQVFRSALPKRIPFSGSSSIQFDVSDSRLRGPFTGKISGVLEFSGDRASVSIERFDPIVRTFQTPLGPNTATISLVRSDDGSFDHSTGTLAINALVKMTHTQPLAGSSEIELGLTTGRSSRGDFNLTGSALDSRSRKLRLVAASTTRGGYMIDGSDCAVTLDLEFDSSP